MSKYSEIKKDFVKRTLDNLKHAETSGIPYEFTNLVNNCFGLIVFPKSFQNNDSLKAQFPEHYFKYGLTIQRVEKILDSDESLGSIIIHLRNGLAHGLIEQEVQNGDIAGIRICDKKNDKGDIHTEIHLTVEELHKIALFVAEKVQP